MAVSIRDAKFSRHDRGWIESAYRDYLHALSAGGTGVFPALTVTGQQPADLLDNWFRDERSSPFLILREGEPAGFALVQRCSAARSGPQASYRLSEFFISPAQRRLGLGREAARLLFDRFPGQWLVTTPARYGTAVAFWRRVVGSYAGRSGRERVGDGEFRFSFGSPAREQGRD